MYRHCIYCASDLGSNQAVEEFQVGRRLAFDAGRGRLWVVCAGCERWNLSPLEERWEALEALEQRFHDTRARASTENIGLARLDEGLELVRVGRPKRPEFAAWRYGDQFGRRRRKFIVGTAIGAGVVAAAGAGALATAASLSTLMLPLHFWSIGRAFRRRAHTTLVHTASQGVLEIPEYHVGDQKVRPSADHPEGWVLEMSDAVERRPALSGPDAVHALSVLLPRLNARGAGKAAVRAAVRHIEESGSPEAYFRDVELRARSRGWGYGTLRALPDELRLALEMSANEEQERAALEGELEQLEAAWREAEEVAAIADDLLLPQRVWKRLEEFRAERQSDS